MREDIKQRIEAVHEGSVLEGYKYTFRLSPASWKEYPLKKMAKKVKQKNQDNAVTKVLSNTAMHGVIRQADYFEKDIANSDNTDGYYVVEEKDFVYNPRISSMAPYGPIRANELGIKGVVSPLYTVFRLNDSDKFEYDFMRYYFESSQWYKYMYTVANYGARHDRMNISSSDFFDLPIALPSLKEQQRIVEILNYCSKVIELKQQLIEEERKRKKWLMQNLLNPDSGVRLQGFEGIWANSLIKNVAIVISGGTPSTNNPDYWNGSILWCTPTDISKSNKYINVTEQTISESGLKNSSAALLPIGTVLMCSRASIGPKAIAAQEITTNQGFKSFVCSDKLNNEFLYYLLEVILVDLLRLASGNTFKELSKDSVDNYMITIPDIKEQVAIAEVLSAQDVKIDLLEQELSQWQQKKKALMQLLLTGIVRVSV